MPVNDPGDRVHNFFAQDNSLQGKHHPQFVEGNWPVLNSNIWGGSQGQVDQFNSNSKNYSSKNSDVDRGEASYSLDATHGLNFITQTNLRPDLVKNQSLNEQPNGFMYANQLHQTRPNEANFLGMDTDSDHLQSMTLRGMSAPDVSQGVVAGHQVKASDRSEISVSPVGFDFFGGQQQMSHQQPDITQSLLRQHSGINDMQQLQQQLLIRKMQEIKQQQQVHQQQQIHQLDLRQQYLNDQVTSFTKQASGRQPMLVNGTSNSDTSPYPPIATFGNWLNQGSPSMQGSPNGLGYPPNIGQTQRFLDSVSQNTEQSLYGVPISTSRGLNMNSYSQNVTDRASTPQMSSSSNSLQGNQPNLLPERVGVQDETVVSRHNFQNENMFGFGSNQSLNSGLRNTGILQQGNSEFRNVTQQEAAQEKPNGQVASQNEVSLDPAEEKILFGSDDNIWAAFGKGSQLGGETTNAFDNDASDDCLAVSLQSGSWSALMQSAVAETSSNDIAPQEEWSGLTFQNNSGPSRSQPLSYPNKSRTQEASILDGTKQTPSALSSLSLPLSNDFSPTDTRALNQHGQKFQNEHHKRMQTDMPQMFLQSLGEAGKWSNCGPLQNSVAEGSQLFTDASQHTHQTERNAKTLVFPGQTGTRIQSNCWNAQAAVQPKGDGVMNAHDTTNFLQNCKNTTHVGVIQEEVIHGSSSWKSNSLPSSAVELGNGKFGAHNAGANHNIDNQDILLKHWKSAHSSGRSQGGESLGRLLDQADNSNQVLDLMNSHEKDEVSRHESDSHNVKENSSDSYRSNLSQHTSGGLRDSGLSDATDSRPLSAGKQKLTNQLSRKVSAPRKFQYHPMGNVDEHVEPAYGMKPPSHAPAVLQKNAHFGQAKVYGQVTRNSTLAEKGQSSEFQRDSKSFNQDPSQGDIPGHMSHRPRTIDTLNNGSSSSQNMLELFNKADQSRNHGDAMQFNSINSSSQLPETEKYDDFVRLQHNQSYSSQGFGLQLGPPSQRQQISDHSLSSQSGQDAFYSPRSNNAVAEMGDRRRQMAALHSVQSLPYSEETQVQFQHNVSAITEHEGNKNSSYKTSGTFTSASPGIPFSRSNEQNQKMSRVSGHMVKHSDSFDGNASCSAQRTAESLQSVASGSFQLDKHDAFGSMSLQSGQSAVERVPTANMATRDKEQTSQHFSMSGISQHGNSAQVLHGMYTNASTHQQNIDAKFQQVSRISELAQSNVVESSSPLMHDHENPCGANVKEQSLKESSSQQVVSPNTDMVPAVKKSLEKTSFMNHLDDARTPSLWKNIQAFDGSVKPNTISHQSYSFLHNMHGSKDAEINLGRRVTDRMKGVGNVADSISRSGSQNEHTGVLSGDSKIVNLPVGSADMLLIKSSQEGNATSRDILGLNQDVSQNDSSIGYLSSHKVDHAQVSSEMVPLWLNQSGNNKNGEMLQHHDTLNVTPLRPRESYTFGRCSSGLDMVSSEGKRSNAPVDTLLNSNSHHNFTPSLIGSGQLSLKSSQPDDTDQNLEISRPKKRKSATLDLHPWHKEISDVSLDHVTNSLAEPEWDKATNSFRDKVEDDAELIEDVPPIIRSKRRLVLTTHLMQKLLHPAPTSILSADARASYDALVYAVSRTGLGDACSTVNQSSSSDGTKNLLPLKGRSSARNDIRRNATVAEGLLDRVGKLENEFSRMDKSASVLDLRLECQDLEKFAVINRFARFHGRGQSDNADTASSITSAMSQKPIPQRYVTALPLPRNIPDGAPCLSL